MVRFLVCGCGDVDLSDVRFQQRGRSLGVQSNAYLRQSFRWCCRMHLLCFLMPQLCPSFGPNKSPTQCYSVPSRATRSILASCWLGILTKCPPHRQFPPRLEEWNHNEWRRSHCAQCVQSWKSLVLPKHSCNWRRCPFCSI